MSEEGLAIKIDNVSKKFSLGATPNLTFREAIAGLFQFSGGKEQSEFWALKDISFKAYRNEVIGIIGRNGAGKSTLLKILSRITKPTNGRVEITGRMTSLLEVGTGFHPELTGRENIFLNGAILGMNRNEIRSKLNEIIDYSGVKEFINTPVKHYSSGMKVRLAFSVAAHLDAEVMIIDEVLAVGDVEFQKKCLGTMEQVAGSGKTVLFVSHNMGAVSQLCNRALIMEQGKIDYDGYVQEAVNRYSTIQDQLKSFERETLLPDKSIQATQVFLKDINGQRSNSFPHDQPIELNIVYHAQKFIKGMNICISVYNYLRYPVFTSDVPLNNFASGFNQASVRIPSNVLKPGHYSFLVAIHSPNKGVKATEYLQYICPMTIYDNGSEFSQYEGIWETGDVFVQCKWDFT